MTISTRSSVSVSVSTYFRPWGLRRVCKGNGQNNLMNRSGGCNSPNPFRCHPLHLPAHERHAVTAASPCSAGGGYRTRRPDDIRCPEASGDAMPCHRRAAQALSAGGVRSKQQAYQELAEGGMRVQTPSIDRLPRRPASAGPELGLPPRPPSRRWGNSLSRCLIAGDNGLGGGIPRRNGHGSPRSFGRRLNAGHRRDSATLIAVPTARSR
jgi:hypothetical protein